MNARTHERMTAAAAKVYAHRLAMDPETCPVCCGDRTHTDPRFSAGVSHVIDEGRPMEREAFHCICTVTPEGGDTLLKASRMRAAEAEAYLEEERRSGK